MARKGQKIRRIDPKDIFTESFFWTHGSKRFDFRNNTERYLGWKYILSVIPSTNRAVFYSSSAEYAVPDSDDGQLFRRAMTDMFGIECILNHNEFASFLSLMIQKLSHTTSIEKRYQMLIDLHYIVFLLRDNESIIKQIFTENYVQLSFAFIHLLIVAALNTMSVYKSKPTKLDFVWYLLICIKYWQPIHFKYSVHYFPQLLQTLVKFTVKNQKRLDHKTGITDYYAYILSKEFTFYAEKKGGSKLVDVVIKKIALELGIWSSNMLTDIQSRPRSRVSSRKYVCGWMLCNKKRDSFGAKNKCTGCAMLYYCSRTHQKMHWKYIHSQQCWLID
eukprot:503685_1